MLSATRRLPFRTSIADNLMNLKKNTLLTKLFLFKILLVCSVSCFSYSVFGNEVIKLPNYSMKMSMETTASKATIWRLWEDVENWKQFDERLEYSYLLGEKNFEEGAIGYLKGKGAPKTRFVLTQVTTGVSFVEVLKLPLGQTIHLQRYFEISDNNKTIFTHEVNFKGRLKPLYYWLLAGEFKKDLKKVMLKMKLLAETSNPG